MLNNTLIMTTITDNKNKNTSVRNTLTMTINLKENNKSVTIRVTVFNDDNNSE